LDYQGAWPPLIYTEEGFTRINFIIYIVQESLAKGNFLVYSVHDYFTRGTS